MPSQGVCPIYQCLGYIAQLRLPLARDVPVDHKCRDVSQIFPELSRTSQILPELPA